MGMGRGMHGYGSRSAWVWIGYIVAERSTQFR